jgi:cytochrome c-type biogenesis protein CcmH/NrfG
MQSGSADAESFARRSVQIDPKNAVGWDRLGVALQARGLLNSETEHSYRRAIELDPQFAAAYAHLARMLNRSGKPVMRRRCMRKRPSWQKIRPRST